MLGRQSVAVAKLLQIKFGVAVNTSPTGGEGYLKIVLCQSFLKQPDYLAINPKKLKNPNALKS